MNSDEAHNDRLKSVTPKVLFAGVENQGLSSQLVQTLVQETRYFVLIMHDYKHTVNIAEDISPDLFLFDYALLYDDGMTRYQQLRTNIVHKNIPLLVLNAPVSHAKSTDDMVALLTQPVRYSTLLFTIETLLAKAAT